MTATNLRVVPAAPAPARWLGRVLVIAVIAFFSYLLRHSLGMVAAGTDEERRLNSAASTASRPSVSDPSTSSRTTGISWSRFQDGIIWTWLGNSVFYSVVALVITILITIPAGYALAMTKFRLRRFLLITTLMVMLIPNTALALPIFLELSAIHVFGSPLAVILPFSFFPFGVYLAYIYFSTTMSHDLLDAARIDGAGEFRVFTRIAMPLATPVIALVGFFSFVGNWNNYFLPFIMEPGARTVARPGRSGGLALEHPRRSTRPMRRRSRSPFRSWRSRH